MAKNSENPRVRIAPSPTGFLHVGTARTALYNYLFAKQNQGDFVLRVEDTDEKRSKEKYEKDVLRHLGWLGLNWDEGPKDADDRGDKTAENRGKSADEADLRLSASNKKNNSFFNQRKSASNYGPYRQSKRTEIYKEYIEKLLKQGKAFYCFHQKRRKARDEEYRLTQDEEKGINADKKKKDNGDNEGSRVHWCEHKELSKKEVQKRLEAGEEYVIRFDTPEGETVTYQDKIHGEVSYKTEELGDFSLAKSKTEPLYNLACVVDDYEMKISHVIRGEDHIPNTPKQILLYRALDLEAPQFAHLPLILGEDEKKLSKRHGSTSVKEYKNEGYLPEALVNFMALLGWHPKSDEEIFSLEELEEKFSLDRVRPTGAIFNQEKLEWFNKQHLKRADEERVARLSADYLEKEGFLERKGEEEVYLPKRDLKVDWKWLEKVVALEQKRAAKLKEIPRLVDFFFKDSIEYESKLLVWKDFSRQEIKKALRKAKTTLEGISAADFEKDNLEEILIEKANTYDDRGLFLWPLRVALTGKEGSPGPFAVAELLGKEECEKRVEAAIEKMD